MKDNQNKRHQRDVSRMLMYIWISVIAGFMTAFADVNGMALKSKPLSYVLILAIMVLTYNIFEMLDVLFCILKNKNKS